MSARFIPACAIALLCIASSAESQSFQRIALTSCRLPGVDGEARCGSYEVYEDRRARKGRRIALKITVLPALGSKPLPDALFILAGGPGQAATENADFIARGSVESLDISCIDRIPQTPFRVPSIQTREPGKGKPKIK